MATRDETLQVIDAAHRFYRSQVRNSWVFDVLFARNLADAIQPGQIGYAPPGWTTTTTKLLASGYSEDALIDAGISRRSSRGGLVDALRDRMIFPIRDLDGHICGFTGRASSTTADPRTPKYLNSASTSVYDKSQLLYGLGEAVEEFTAAPAERQPWPVIVEGPLDRWAIIKVARAASLPLVPVATCGTALTTQQLEAIRSVSPRPIVVCYDADKAGNSAALRAWDLIKDAFPREHHRAIVLPTGSDPAQLIEDGRRGELLASLKSPEPLENRAASVRAARAPRDHAIGRFVAARATIEADAAAIPIANVTPWMQHLSGLYDMPVSEVHSLLLDAVAPTTAAEDQRSAFFPGPPGPGTAPCSKAASVATHPTMEHNLER